MVRDERAPGLRRRLCVSAADVLGDGRLRHLDAQLHQFAVNPWRSPWRVVLRHRSNQGADISRNRWPAEAPATFPGPEQSEALAMPRDDGVGLDDDERRSSATPGA